MTKKKNKSGFSLVEILVATLLLLVLLLAGAMVLYTTGADVQIYGNKRVALELARSQMEGLLSTDYDSLRARAVAAGNPETGSRTVTTNDVTLGINWTNRLVSSGGILRQVYGGSQDNEYIELDVSAAFPGDNNSVLLQAVKTK